MSKPRTPGNEWANANIAIQNAQAAQADIGLGQFNPGQLGVCQPRRVMINEPNVGHTAVRATYYDLVPPTPADPPEWCRCGCGGEGRCVRRQRIAMPLSETWLNDLHPDVGGNEGYQRIIAMMYAPLTR